MNQKELFDFHRQITATQCDKCKKKFINGKSLEVAHCIPKWIDKNNKYDKFSVVLCHDCHKEIEKQQLDLVLDWLGVAHD